MSAEGGGCLRFNVWCLSTRCTSLPHQAPTASLMSEELGGKVPDTSVLTLSGSAFPPPWGKLSFEGKWDYICATLYIKLPDMCTKKESVCFCWRWWFFLRGIIHWLWFCFELLKDVSFSFLSLIIYWMSPCSRSFKKNMLAFELVFEKKLHRRKHNN